MLSLLLFTATRGFFYFYWGGMFPLVARERSPATAKKLFSGNVKIDNLGNKKIKNPSSPIRKERKSIL
jgi:hypothetical protein